MTLHPALIAANVAIVTGGASGIGFAAARAFAGLGMRVAIADNDGEALKAAGQVLATLVGAENVLAMTVDVSRREEVVALQDAVTGRFGRVHVLMNNAGIQPESGIFGPHEVWQQTLAVNLGGVVNGTQVFGPGMAAHGEPALIVNTGSKQGITTPPGNPAYNVAKAGVKVFTEALQHELRNMPGCRVSAHLLIPGFVFTPLTARGRVEKPGGAWTPEETVDFMLEGLHAGDFYILCPDGETSRATDEKRMAWAVGDIIANRPPLSRWHRDYKAAFEDFVSGR
ncbi:SDR family NAD(P)-dependent oxidoreductase [Bosea sp. (in: a-proteobacteria)]|uniref:SDR family NAD(P)-dependent oxidoreductase n=1 Tax=Bosea sp. (in: a-proteobacteria) TaxID=1871050 RepID=UPI00120DC821|nr:SDR family NAD(P)-dependent oxidoreductase [Bosea sp. (in: a-proteobacteria)]TAJ33521.1 MAG: SDR family NAD(P)-dependent oxidoreductase [Bosea sp. (in: a-proteobacteria)]